MRKLLAGVAAALLVLLVLAAVLNRSLIQQIATFSPIILPSFGPAPADDAQARLQDIEYLSSLLRYDRSFDEAESRQFEELLAEGKREVDSMSPADLYLLASRAAALADNAHTAIEMYPIQRDFNAVKARYFPFEDGLYVVRAGADYGQLVGGRVTEIDGQPIESVVTALNPYFGGTDGWRQLQIVLLLESPELLHAAGLAQSPAGYMLTVENRQGDVVEAALTADAPPVESVPDRSAWATLKAEALPDEGAEWVRALQGDSEDLLPLYLRRIDQPYMWAPLDDGGAYVRMQTLFNRGEQTISEFFDEHLKSLPDGSLPYLVFDLRANNGGDFTLFAKIASWLPDKLSDDGDLYVVVGPRTLSAGLNAAALLKFFGGEKTTIVGSALGGREQYWAEYGLPFRLPNSGYQVHYATAYHDWANGCADHPYCFTPVLEQGVAAGSLAPDPVIEPRYADYAAGRDAVMAWIDEQQRP